MSDYPPPLPPTGHLLTELDYISEAAAADALGLTTQSLIKYRKMRRGPNFTVIGRRFMYRRPWLREWLEAGGTGAKPAAKPAPTLAAAMAIALDKPKTPSPKQAVVPKPVRRRPQPKETFPETTNRPSKPPVPRAGAPKETRR